MRYFLLLFQLLALAAVLEKASTQCSDSSSCTISNATLTCQQLADRTAPTTRDLTLSNVTLQQCPPGNDEESASARLAKLNSLSIEGWSKMELAAGTVLSAFKSLRQLRISGRWPFAKVGASPGSGINQLPSLQQLHLQGIKIGSLNRHWLSGLTSLRSLRIENCSLDRLGANALESGAPQLEDLCIIGGNLNSIDASTLGSLPKLRNLTIHENPLQYLRQSALAGLPQLRYLSFQLLNETLIRFWDKTLTDRFASNPQLRFLRLRSTKLQDQQLAGALSELKLLQSLDLSYNCLKKFSPSILPAQQQNLSELDLSKNSISCLFSGNFANLPNLRSLNLSHNSLTVINRQHLTGLKHLQKLDLSGNPQLTIADGAFCGLSALNVSQEQLVSWDADSTLEAAFSCDSSSKSPALSCSPEPLYRRESKYTFLVIIGLCVSFLIVTVLSMIVYKGWNRKRTTEIVRDEEKELELQAMMDREASESKARRSQMQQHHRQKKEANGHRSKNSRPPQAAAATEVAQVEPNGQTGAAVETQAQVQQPPEPIMQQQQDSKEAASSCTSAEQQSEAAATSGIDKTAADADANKVTTD